MKRNIVTVGVIALVLLGAAGLGTSIYWYTKYQHIAANPVAGSEEEVAVLVKKLSAFIELPPETPSVVTITDRDKLQSQQFFQKAANGDKVIIYESIRRIILYRPSIGKIIDIAPLAYNDQQQSPDPNVLPPIKQPEPESPPPSDAIPLQFSPSPTPLTPGE